MKAEPVQCECCGDELGQVFPVDISFGPVCDDCSEGIYIGRHEMLKNGVKGITIKLPPTR